MIAQSNINTHIDSFQAWLQTDEKDAPTWQKEHKDRLEWYKRHLTREGIRGLTQEAFGSMIKRLWAVNIWHNKDYKVGRLIKDNGFEKLKVSIEQLFYDNESIDKRWDKFRVQVKGFGPSSLSEILTFFDPQQYALANLKPYRVLPLLGFPIEAVSDGASYKKAIEQIGKVKQLLLENGLQDADFIITDFFIAYLFYYVFDLSYARKGVAVKTQPKEKSKKKSGDVNIAGGNLSINSHEAAEAILLMLGNLLGYDTYTPDASRIYDGQKLGDIATLTELPYFASEKIMDSVQNIDVVWLKDEWPEYFFEVEHTTGVTPGLLRIFQAEKINTKFFIVGPQDVLKRFEREVEKAPFNRIKDKYRFRSYEELGEMYSAAASYHKIAEDFLENKEK
ncbi:MAG: hypothetical protein HY515_04010 [Candidatus Aenigmarchaeota archaeon]|nr:hypothetical protein [Candidatus Aenigmarchaeota archaeon]